MGIISLIFNFDDIGIKIKNLAKWFCWITILLIWIATPISFIALVADDYTAEFCWIPLVSAIVAPIFIWVSSWFIYAFGEHIEDTHAIRYNSQITNIDKNLQLLVNLTTEKTENHAGTATQPSIREAVTTPANTSTTQSANNTPTFQARTSVSSGTKTYADGEYVPGRIYSNGDTVLFEGKKFVCIAQGSTVWSPAVFPSQWQEISE